MNFKAWNIKKGLKRIWIIGSVFWFVFSQWLITKGDGDAWVYPMIILGVIFVGLWWALLYLGFWVARGFVDDDDKKAGF